MTTNKGLLSGEKDSLSSMRFSFILVSIGAFVLLCSAAFYIAASALNPEQLGEPSWEAIGIFSVGIAGVLTGIGYTKVQQKKLEQ